MTIPEPETSGQDAVSDEARAAGVAAIQADRLIGRYIVEPLTQTVVDMVLDAAAPHIRAQADAVLRDQDAFTTWWKTCDVSRLTAGHLGDMYADYLADTLSATGGQTADIPCQVYRPGPHGQRLCVRTLRDKPPCCFPTRTTDRTPA